MKTKLFPFIVLMAFVLGSCAKKTDNTPSDGPPQTYDNSYTLTGGAFKNSVYNISNVTYQKSSYDTTSGITTINISGTSGDSITIAFTITIKGNVANTYSVSSDNSVVIAVTHIKGSQGLQDYVSSSGNITISNYGAIGGTVSGTFSGTFANTGDNYTISNATFSAKRVL